MRDLARIVARSKSVSLSNVEAAVQRELGIDVTGRLTPLLEPLSKAHAIFEVPA